MSFKPPPTAAKAGAQVKIISLTRDVVKFELLNVDLAIGNALRRIMISEVPTMAIDLVEVKENTSALHDEFIVHRIGLVPLKCPEDTASSHHIDKFAFAEDCQCPSMCDKCTVKFNFKSQCGDEVKEVTSKDMHIDPQHQLEEESLAPVTFFKDEACEVEEPPILLMKLAKGQQLDFELVAKKGIGKVHAKWSPVATCVMRKQPLVALNKELMNAKFAENQKRDFVKTCPRKVFGFDEQRKAVEVERPDDCILCQECTKFAADNHVDRAVQIGENDCRLIFTVESTGALEPTLIVSKALEILMSKLHSLRECMLKYAIVQQ